MRRHPASQALIIFAIVAIVLLPGALAGQSFDEDDAQTERCLAEGEILKKIKTIEGVTRPEIFAIECDGQKRQVLVKRLDESHRGVTRFEEGTWEVNFTDSFRYERAAYLLDRELAMNMVPVAVIRDVKRQESAVLEWIDHAAQEKDSEHTPSGTQRANLAQQKATMNIFDALIGNTDRNIKNWLVDDEDWSLYLVDHSRAFRNSKDLPETYLEKLSRLPRPLYDRLLELEEEHLVEILAGLISRGQVEAMLARRDKIIEKIDGDCAKVGDDVVFSVASIDG